MNKEDLPDLFQLVIIIMYWPSNVRSDDDLQDHALLKEVAASSPVSLLLTEAQIKLT